MRRTILLASLILFAAAGGVFAIALSTPPDPTPTGRTIPLPPDAYEQWVRSQWVPVHLEPLSPEELAERLAPDDSNPGAQYCGDATVLDLPSGGQTTVNNMAEEPADPALTCVWGTPAGSRGNQGYRTIWYQLTAAVSGRLVVTLEPNVDYHDNYDTVVGVFSGSCGSLTMLACNDDANGLLSGTLVRVQEGQTYYIEIADRNFGVSGDAIANLNAYIDVTATGEFWQDGGVMPVPRSRHAVVSTGSDLYVIAGQTVASGNPVRTGQLERFTPATGAWTTLANMPGPDGLGYSNTTAVFRNNRIYLPGGFVGDINNYDGTHWVYDIPTNAWSILSPIPWNLSPPDAPAAYQAAVVPDSTLAPPGYYLTGGISGQILTTTSTVRDDLWFYFINSNSWLLLDSSRMLTARYAHTAAWVGGRLCVIGGIGEATDVHVLLSGGECYDIISDSWSPIDELNVPRYNAGSAVGPDGRWFVFGGTTVTADGFLIPASTTEVYDPNNGVWLALDYRWDLANPARSWPRGGFVGNDLWVIGGETVPGANVIPLVEKLYVPIYASRTLFPVLFYTPPFFGPGSTIFTAGRLSLNVAENHRFVDTPDLFHLYYFDLPAAQNVTVRLTNIPLGANYDVEIYNSNKLRVGQGTNIGNLDETVTLSLAAGRYYVQVIRAFPVTSPPPAADYRIKIEG